MLQKDKAMTKIITTILWFLFVIGGLYLAFRITGWKMKKACDFIIHDLREKKALDPYSAVPLPYSKSELLHIGLRDYRPRALEELVKLDMVQLLEGGRYYLREDHIRTDTGGKTET